MRNEWSTYLRLLMLGSLLICRHALPLQQVVSLQLRASRHTINLVMSRLNIQRLLQATRLRHHALVMWLVDSIIMRLLVDLPTATIIIHVLIIVIQILYVYHYIVLFRILNLITID